MHEHNRVVNVTGYDPRMGLKKDIRVVSAVVAYDDPNSGETVFLQINQAICIASIRANLLCPMQLRLNDVRVDECPKFLAQEPTDKTHAIVINDGNEDEFTIPLSLHGIMSYLPTRKPTLEEYNNHTGAVYELTADEPEWSPHSMDYAREEAEMMDSNGMLKDNP